MVTARLTRCLGVSLASLVSLLLSSCGGGGGGGAGSVNTLELITIRTGSGLHLPADELHLNEPIVIEFNGTVDPASVHPDSIRIRRRRQIGGVPVGTAYSVEAIGEFQVVDNRVTFVPAVPARGDFTDAGLTRDALYRIEIPGFPELDTVRSPSGARLASTRVTTFRTKTTMPLVLDPVVGAPTVLSVGLDLDGDGAVDADDDPNTASPEEILDFASLPFLVEVPVGLARQPMQVALVLNEPILAESLFAGSLPGLAGNKAFLRDAATGERILSRIELALDFLPDEGRFLTRILYTPTSTLPPRTRIEIHLEGIQDLAGNEIDRGRFLAAFDTRTAPGTFDDALEEEFEDRFNMDPETTAAWNIGDSKSLVAGLGIGGSGLDGRFLVPPDGFAILDTDVNRGQFNFTEFRVEDGATVEVIGSNPLKISSQGDVHIAGFIDLRGDHGEDGTNRVGMDTARGGAAVAGGTPGADSGQQQSYTRGAGPDGAGGGQGGISEIRNPGGGGGGGHSRFGGTLSTVGNRWAGRGGVPYGTQDIRTLFAGSGGGGGGHYFQFGEFRSGAGGGGGGGAIAFDVGGTFFFIGNADIDTDGGDGGTGGLAPPGELFGAGGGGGGSGGAVRVRAAEIVFDTTEFARLGAVGGQGGMVGGGNLGGGGGGATGRIYFETLDHNGDGQPNDFLVDPLLNTSPPMVRGLLPEEDLGKSAALSRFLDTGTDTPTYAFNGNDPDTGEIRQGPDVADVVLPASIPPDATVSIRFEGAHGRPDAERTPDLDTLTGFTPRIEDLHGYRFIRYRIEFDIGPDVGVAQRPVLESLRIRFTFGI